MTADEEEGGVHPQRTAAVRQKDRQLRKIDRHVVDVHGVAEAAARAGEHRCACVDRHRNAGRLRYPVEIRELRQRVLIGVGAEQLMRRMDLERPRPMLDDARTAPFTSSVNRGLTEPNAISRAGSADAYCTIQSFASSVNPIRSGLT